MIDFKLIDINLTDYAWLETLDDCIDLDMPLELIKINLKCRKHLEKQKRILRIDHLKQVN